MENPNNLKPTTPLSKIILATFVSGLGMWIIAGLYHTIVAVAFYKAETEAEHEGIGLILLAYLILGLLMSYGHSLIFTGKSTLLQSTIYGGIVGILWVFPHELAMAGAHGESLAYVFKNGLWHMIEQGFGGLMIGVIFMYSIKKSS